MPPADIALLVMLAVGLVAGARWLGTRIERRGEAARRRDQGKRNAELEQRRLDEVCIECGRPVDPQKDVYENGAWWCVDCWRKLHE
jgi:hypothetical protein